MPVYFGTIIHPNRTVGQLVLNRSEGYILSQAQGSGLTTVKPMGDSGKSDNLGYVGVRASDLTLDFLFYDFVREDKEETIGGFVPCRVMVLSSPDKKEFVRVFLSKSHYFPLRAEFLKPEETKPWRTLETGGFAQKNDLYYIRRVRVEGPGWRTRIEFKEAELGLFDPQSVPKNLIRKISVKK